MILPYAMNFHLESTYPHITGLVVYYQTTPYVTSTQSYTDQEYLPSYNPCIRRIETWRICPSYPLSVNHEMVTHYELCNS